MDYITKLAKEFVRTRIRGNVEEKYKRLIIEAQMQLEEIDLPADKIKFLDIVLEGNQKVYNEHLKSCTDLENCGTNFGHESITYFLAQELSRLGIKLSDDTFSNDDRLATSEKLDLILEEVEKLKMGQEIIYEDLKSEVEELRKLYFLGKKKWHQIFLGKFIDMVATGVISKTVSKKLIEIVNDIDWTKLIN